MMYQTIFLLLAGMSGVMTQSCQTQRIRYEWNDLPEAEKQRWLTTVGKLQDTGVMEKFTKQHFDQFSSWHLQAVFFPAHRQFVRAFDEAMRAVDPLVQAPYWDWSLQAANPSADPIWNYFSRPGGKPVTEPMFKGKIANIPNAHQVVRGINSSGPAPDSYVPTDVIDNIIKNTADFNDFSTTIEQGGHRQIHIQVGLQTGDLSWSYSFNDPLFILHHTYIDYIWWRWQSIGNNMNKYDGPIGTQLTGAVASDALPGESPFKVSDMFNIHTLCYDYAPPGTQFGSKTNGSSGAGAAVGSSSSTSSKITTPVSTPSSSVASATSSVQPAKTSATTSAKTTTPSSSAKTTTPSVATSANSTPLSVVPVKSTSATSSTSQPTSTGGGAAGASSAVAAKSSPSAGISSVTTAASTGSTAPGATSKVAGQASSAPSVVAGQTPAPGSATAPGSPSRTPGSSAQTSATPVQPSSGTNSATPSAPATPPKTKPYKLLPLPTWYPDRNPAGTIKAHKICEAAGIVAANPQQYGGPVDLKQIAAQLPDPCAGNSTTTATVPATGSYMQNGDNPGTDATGNDSASIGQNSNLNANSQSNAFAVGFTLLNVVPVVFML